MKGLFRSQRRGSVRRRAVNRIVVRLNDIVSVDGSSGDGFGGVTLSGMPEGNLLIMGGLVDFSFDDQGSGDIVDTFTPTVAVGGIVLPSASFISTTDDLFENAAGVVAVAGVSSGNRLVVGSNFGVVYDNTDGVKDLVFNVIIPDASITGVVEMLLTGTLHFVYSVLGDD